MAIRVLLAPFFQSAEDRPNLDLSLKLAKARQCHVDALLVQPDPVDIVPAITEGMSADGVKRLMEDARATMDHRRQAAKAVFDQVCAKAGVPVVEHAAMSSGHASVAWREIIGQSEDVVPERALYSDLVIFTGAYAKATPHLRPTFEAVLLRARRPMLLAPAETPDHIGRKVAIAWNGTAEARSALAAAMPFVESADEVHLLTAMSADTDADALDDVSDYLTWRGLHNDTHVVERQSGPMGAALMQKAKGLGADLLVMGGYGHARLRELILGGVTRHIVNNPELPILLAH